MGYALGVTALVRVLRGSRDKQLLGLELDSLSTYGLMKEIPRGEVRELVEYLEEERYLYTNRSTDTVFLTERAKDVLFHGKKVSIARRSPAKPASLIGQPRPTAASDVDEALFAALKALRLKLAAEEHVPAYIVFTNASLLDMARKKPTTMEEFLTVSGVGEYKAERYGKMFLEEIGKGAGEK